MVNGFNAGTQKPEDCCEIGASLGYEVSSRTETLSQTHIHTQLGEINQILSVPPVKWGKQELYMVRTNLLCEVASGAARATEFDLVILPPKHNQNRRAPQPPPEQTFVIMHPGAYT